MKRFLGGILGAVTGALIFSIVWFFASTEGFGLGLTVPLGGIVGAGLGACCAGHADWSQRKAKLIKGSMAAFAAPPGIVIFSWLMVASVREGYWHGGGSKALGSMLFFSAFLTLVGSVFGGIVGAVVGAAICLFVKSPVPNAVQSTPMEGVWPPQPAVIPLKNIEA